MKINARLVMDQSKVEARFASKFQKAQRFLDSEVLRCSAKYVPMRTGALMRSGTNGTVLGSGLVVYNAPYAKPMYYGLDLHFSRDKHPQASAQWFEKSKAVDLPAWVDGVQQIIKE